MGGAIELLTRDAPYQREGTIDLSAGQYAFRKMHFMFGDGNERAGFMVQGVHLANNGFKDLDGGGDTGFARNEWMVKGRYSPNPFSETPHEFQLKLGYSDEGSNETYLGLTDADFAQTPYRRYPASAHDRMDWRRSQIVLRHRVRLSNQFEIETTTYRQNLVRVWNRFKGLAGIDVNDVLANPDSAQNQVYYSVLRGQIDTPNRNAHLLIGPNDRGFLSYGIQTIARYAPTTGSLKHHVEYGVRFHYDEAERYQAEDRYNVLGGSLERANEPTHVTDQNRASTHAVAVHITDAVTWSRISITPGFRFESIHSRYEDALTKTSDRASSPVVLPGVGLYVELTRDFGAFGGIYRGFSPPAPGDSKNNRPEMSVNYETGVRYSTKHAHAEVIAFYNDYSNITAICSVSSGCAERNIDRQFDGGSARIYGVEALAEGDVRLTRGWVLPLRAVYTYTNTEYRTGFTADDPLIGTVKPGDYMPYVPMHQASSSIGVEHGRFTVNVSGTFVDWMRERPGRDEPQRVDRTDPYFLLDASSNARVLKRVTIYLNARNLLDATYLVSHRPFGARPGAPRWITAGVRWNF